MFVAFAADDFIFHVLYAERAYIEVLESSALVGPSSGQSAPPNTVISFTIIYKGGYGEDENGNPLRANAWDIFIYDRSDTPATGTPNSPEELVPEVFDINPKTPLSGSPVLGPADKAELTGTTAKLLYNRIYVRAVEQPDGSIRYNLFHVGTFKVRTPIAGTDPGQISENVTFTGQARIGRA